MHKKDCKKQAKRKVLGDNYAKRCSSFVKLNLFFYLSICYLDLNSVAYVYFENSGSVSILPKGEQRPTIAVDLVNLKIEKASPPIYLIIDGKICKEELNELKKDTNWLLKKLNIQKKKQMKNILLLEFVEKLNSFNIHYKNKD